jgi:large subunit ribosomal protein L2
MALKKSKPITPGRRGHTGSLFEEITRDKPERSLIEARSRRGGRNSAGRISVRHRGGGSRRHYRRIDFLRDKAGVAARVAAIEYDPNRSALLALLQYRDGEKRYILAPLGLKPGAEIVSGPDVEPLLGNALPLAKIPLGTDVHCVEMVPGRGAKMIRAAGNSAQLMAREGGWAHLRLPSGEIRRVLERCVATVGKVGNPDWSGQRLGKAGRRRWRGIRPTVRGVAMNPVDHPMGGGEGRTSGGGHPRSPWGQWAKGGKTRVRRKPSSRFIIKRRK